MPERNAKVRRRLAAGKLRLRIRDLRNLGPRAEVLLAAIGITSVEALRARGALECFLALRRANLARSLNLLWALAGALEPWPEGRDAREIAAGPERLALLLAIEAREGARRAVQAAATPKSRRGSQAGRKSPARAVSVPGMPFSSTPKRKNRH